MLRVGVSRSLPFPFLDQLMSICVPFLMVGNSGEQGGRAGAEVKLSQDVAERAGPFVVLVDLIECVACSLYR